MAKSNIKPGTAGIWIGILLMVLSLGSCIGGVGWGLAGFIGQLQDVAENTKDRVPVNASQVYNFEDDASGVIIGVATTSSEAKSIDVTLKGPKGEVDLTKSSSYSGSGDVNGTAFEFLASFDGQPSGKYTLSSTGPEGASVAIVPISMTTVGQRIIGGIGLGLVMFIVGLILMIITMTRRSRAKKAIAAVGGPPPAMGTPPGPGGFGAPPAPGGYGVPPAPGAPPAPGGYPPQPPQQQVPPQQYPQQPAPQQYPQQPAPPQAPSPFEQPQQPQPYAPAPEAPPFAAPPQQQEPPAPPQAPGGYPPPPPPPPSGY